MATIGLIRHGITDWNELGKAQGISDIPLNETGIRQAYAIASRLLGEQWDIIASSSLTRAKQTAEIISASLKMNPVTIDDRLREINCGLIEGTTEEERILEWGENWRTQNLGMESFTDVAKRGMEFIEEICAKHPDQKILVVSHGALIGLSLQHLLPSVFSKTYIENTALTILTLQNKIWECKLYNCTKHLTEMRRSNE